MRYFKPAPPEHGVDGEDSSQEPSTSAGEAPRSRFGPPVVDDSHLSDHRNWRGEWVDKSFSGERSLLDFLDLLITHKREFRGYTVIAHNFRGFDGILLLRNMLERNVIPNCILKGQKIMTMNISGCNLRFVDSFNFLPMALAKLPAAFGLNVGEKGYFPHFFNVKGHENYKGPLPKADCYGVDGMSEVDRRKFFEWYNAENAKGTQLDMQCDIAKYCEQDVNILTESCLAYRRLMCEETCIDPLQYITCASVCKTVYLSTFMKPGTIARVPPAGYSNARYSGESLEWLEWLRLNQGVKNLQHVANCVSGEKAIARYHADGYDPDTNTVYEYNGCKFHGCPQCELVHDTVQKKSKNPYSGKPLYVCYQKTLNREQCLKSMGFNVISIWGCEWKKKKEEDVGVRDFIERADIQKPLNPRHGFYGGRTEEFKLFLKGILSYEDVTSLYPWVNFCKKYPIGHPKIIFAKEGDLSIDEYFGLIRCKVLPPRDLYIPVLPAHVGPSKKLIFALCRSCAERMQSEMCCHSDEERTMTGVWFSEELKLALRKGYVITKLESIWHFEETSEDLFRDYVAAFYKKKLLSSKLPFKTPAEIEKYICDVKEREGIEITKDDVFAENPGLRSLTKLLLNNLWGRFGMRENLTKSSFLSSFEKLVELMKDPAVEVTGVRIITDSTIQVAYRAKSLDDLPMARDTNIFIAVTTTAWARIRLYEELDKLGERAVYCDTDSVIYKKSEKHEENLETGPFLGQMTNELGEDQNIVEFCSGGPKNYAYMTSDGKAVVKVKGFSLNAINSTAFSFQNLRNVILSGVEMASEVVPEHGSMKRVHANKRPDKKDKAECREQLMSEHLLKGNEASAFANERAISCYNPRRIFRSRDFKLLKKSEQKMYMFCFDKRIVLENFDTVPYGYVGHVG